MFSLNNDIKELQFYFVVLRYAYCNCHWKLGIIRINPKCRVKILFKKRARSGLFYEKYSFTLSFYLEGLNTQLKCHPFSCYRSRVKTEQDSLKVCWKVVRTMKAQRDIH